VITSYRKRGKNLPTVVEFRKCGKTELKQLFGDLRKEDERVEADTYPRSFATTVLPHSCLSKVGKNNDSLHVYFKGTVA
jgi:hypothetical protein